MELDLIKAVASLGVGAVFGLVVFFVYRTDRKDTEKRMAALLQQDLELRKEENETRKENTGVLSSLKTLIERLNGKKN